MDISFRKLRATNYELRAKDLREAVRDQGRAAPADHGRAAGATLVSSCFALEASDKVPHVQHVRQPAQTRRSGAWITSLRKGSASRSDRGGPPLETTGGPPVPPF